MKNKAHWCHLYLLIFWTLGSSFSATLFARDITPEGVEAYTKSIKARDLKRYQAIKEHFSALNKHEQALPFAFGKFFIESKETTPTLKHAIDLSSRILKAWQPPQVCTQRKDFTATVTLGGELHGCPNCNIEREKRLLKVATEKAEFMMEESPVEQTADVGFELSRAGLPSLGQYSSKELQKSTYGLESNLLNQMQYGLDALDSLLTFLSENPKLLNEQIKLKAPDRNTDDYYTDPSTALAYDAAGLVIRQVTGPYSKKLSNFFDQKAPKAKKIVEQVVAQLKQHSSEIDSMNDAVRIVLQGDFSKLSYKDLLDLINSHLEFYQKSELEAELQRLGIPKDLSTELKDFVSAQFESDNGDFEVIKELFFVLRNVGMAHNIAEKFCSTKEKKEIIAQMGEHHTGGVEFLLKKFIPKERLHVARDATTFLEYDTEQRLNHLKKSSEEIQTAK